MATFQKLISGNDYCQGGSTVYSINSPINADNNRCQNSIMGDVMDGRLDDIDYYSKKTEVSTSAWSSAFSSAFG